MHRRIVIAAVSQALAFPVLGVAADLSNTVYGNQAAPNIASGYQDTAIGEYAGYYMKNGSGNTVVGASSMTFNDGQRNTALGALAAYDAYGDDNTVMGHYAFSGISTTQGPNIVNGSSNVAVGVNAMAMANGGNASYNVAVGSDSLTSASYASQNTAVGYFALHDNTTGNFNVAVGTASLQRVLTGSYNTSVGTTALQSVSGSYNTGVGFGAAAQSTTDGLTAVGAYALFSDTTGPYNVAVGNYALNATTTGGDNVGVGAEALRFNVTGSSNMAIGRSAMRNSTSGGFNSMLGYASCWACRSASQNVGIGFKTLYSLTGGNYNVAIGYQAGYNVSGAGSYNIDIGNLGMSGDNGTIRIGADSTQNKTYIAGIAKSKANWAPVYVNQDGQLGTLASAQRYKENVQSLLDPAEKLARLRPVTFHLKSDPKGPVQYGLIAEEVAAVYPELVIRDAQGAIQGIRYDELTPLLLKQVQALQAAHAADQAGLEAGSRRQHQLETRLVALEALIQPSSVVVAAR